MEEGKASLQERGQEPQAAPSSRYRLEEDGGRVTCISVNAPNITLSYERGVTVTPFMARRMPRGTIFLDGACSGPPFFDNRRRHYSLDHHSGCIRSFTLAACEQAAVVIHEGMPLTDGSWTIVINAIDLDSILAAWVLMNHSELLCGGKRLLAAAMPLIRVEGCIDAHGLEAGVLAGVGEDERLRLEARLRELFLLAKDAHAPGPAGEGPVIARLLSAFDSLVLPPTSIQELLSYEELGRVQLAGGGIALAVRSGSGLYEAEEFFKARYGDSLDILVLAQGGGLYSLRLVNRFMQDDLGKLYALLNKRDPFVMRSAEKGDNVWGGSSSIGGSPRQSGSGLDTKAILDAIDRAYSPLATRLRRLLAQKRRSR